MSKKYEIMYILKPELAADAIKAENESLQKILTDNGATVTKVDESLGLRDLAYEIKKCKKGYYVVLSFETSDNKAIKEFDRLTRVNSNVLRFLLTVSE
jgi:small subunit ribosomal protein S6